MPIEAIAQPSEPRQREVFAHGQHFDIADTAAVEIARGRMMFGMSLAPEIVRRQRQHTDGAADPVVSEAVAEKRAMTAVVLDHEQANQKARRRHGDQQRQPPIAEIHHPPRQHPQCDQRHERYGDFENTARRTGFAIARENLCPSECVIGNSSGRRVGQDHVLFGARGFLAGRFNTPDTDTRSTLVAWFLYVGQQTSAFCRDGPKPPIRQPLSPSSARSTASVTLRVVALPPRSGG